MATNVLLYREVGLSLPKMANSNRNASGTPKSSCGARSACHDNESDKTSHDTYAGKRNWLQKWIAASSARARSNGVTSAQSRMLKRFETCDICIFGMAVHGVQLPLATLREPLLTEAGAPRASLFEPPFTWAQLPRALLFEPLLTEAHMQLALLSAPRLTAAQALMATFSRPALTEAWWPLALLPSPLLRSNASVWTLTDSLRTR